MRQEINIVNRVVIGDAIRRAAWRYPKKVAFVDGENRYTYSDLLKHTNQFANYLLNAGYKKGDRIATICLNSYDHVVAMYGINKAGLIWVPVNAALNSSDIEYILDASEAKLVIVDDMLFQLHQKMLSKYKCLLVTNQPMENSFQQVYVNESEVEPDVHIEDRDIAQLMFTSGTTNHPKGVMISNIAVQLAAMGSMIELGINNTFSTVGVLPLFHCAQHTFLHATILIGGKMTTVKKFDPVDYMKIVQDEKVNFAFLLPMMYRAFLYHPERSQYDLSSLETCFYAMAPMDKKTLEYGIRELSADFCLGTGQTEMYPGTVFFKPEYQLSKTGSYWGEPNLINDLAIMDDEGNILPPGQVGEIVHRGPNVMMGYMNNPEETENASKFGWHHTGDLGYVDEDGLLVFVDRKKDMIKTGGENVASIHVEHVLLNCDQVENCVVVGLPHPRWIEAVTAFVIVKEGASEEDIKAYCQQNLSGFQVPKKIIIVDEFPTTSTGKIQKHVLRKKHVDIYQDEPVY